MWLSSYKPQSINPIIWCSALWQSLQLYCYTYENFCTDQRKALSALCSGSVGSPLTPLQRRQLPPPLVLLLLHSHSSRLSLASCPSLGRGGAAVLATLQSSENSIPIKLKTGVYLFIIFLSDLKICRSDAFCCAPFMRVCVCGRGLQLSGTDSGSGTGTGTGWALGRRPRALVRLFLLLFSFFI